MHNENVLLETEKLLEECRPKEALQYLEQNYLEKTKEYFHLKAKILVALSRYTEALTMYSNGVIACKSVEEAIDFKSQIRKERMEIERKFIGVFYKEVNFMYDEENTMAFTDIETYELIEVDKEIAKYIMYDLGEEKIYILVTNSFGEPLNLVEKDEAIEIECMTRLYE